MRQIVLDTETTGLSPDDGHRIIEIGGIELINRKITGNRFHVYINPQRTIDQGAIDVHGIDNLFLADKPYFADIVNDFVAFIDGAELIIHNAPFDVSFINAELRRLAHGSLIHDICSVLDTLALARKKHPGQRNSLDALCKRYGVDNSHRDLHGALLDAEILADVYLMMTGGQAILQLEPLEAEPLALAQTEEIPRPRPNRPTLRVVRCTDKELHLHQRRLEDIAKACKNRDLWTRASGNDPNDVRSNMDSVSDAEPVNKVSQ
jgi:DNA polymerase III subunit epsilon